MTSLPLTSHPAFDRMVAMWESGSRGAEISGWCSDHGYQPPPRKQINKFFERRKASGERSMEGAIPEGGETPRVTIEANGMGTAVSRVYVEGDNLSEEDLLIGWRLDPDDWEIIDGTLVVNRWVQHAEKGTWCYQYKAKLIRKGALSEQFDDLPSVVWSRPANYRCATCGDWFDTSRVGTLYCSAVCRDAYIAREADDLGVVRHIVIPDTQVRPGEPTDHLLWAGRYIKEQCAGERTKIIMIGDHWDMSSLSSYDRGKRAAENRRVRLDLEAGNRAFEVLDEAMGDDPLWEKHFFFGNHEDRITRYVEEHAELEDFLSLDNCVTPPEWIRHDYLEPVWIDGVCFSHYFYHPNTGRPFSGENIEARLKQIGHSFVMGHQQGLKMGMHYAAGRQRFGLVAGSFYQHDESYKGPQGNHHWRGIVVLNDVEDGSFDPMPVSLDYLCRRYEGHRIHDHVGSVL